MIPRTKITFMLSKNRRMLVSLMSLFFASAFAVAACSTASESSKPPAPAARSADVTPVRDASNKTFCKRYFECCTSDSDRSFVEGLLGAKPKTPDECERAARSQANSLGASWKLIENEVAAGKIIVHPENIEKCVTAQTAQSCVQYFDSSATASVCAATLEGTVAIGGACSASTVCKSNFCSGKGVCAAGAVSGDPCGGRPEECGAALYCEELASSSCSSVPKETRTCKPKKPKGAACCSASECATNACATTCIETIEPLFCSGRPEPKNEDGGDCGQPMGTSFGVADDPSCAKASENAGGKGTKSAGESAASPSECAPTCCTCSGPGNKTVLASDLVCGKCADGPTTCKAACPQ